MRLFRSARWLLLALLLPLIPAPQARAGVFISVGFAPPVLPVYVQPPCPEPGYMWTPGYWAYGPDGYYWVPGAWVAAPYVGALWTPPYWGYEGAVYVYHAGYWGPHVGYYGGVNYGFGFFGIGFAGGYWHGGVFAYNTAVVNVNNVYIHNTYIDRTVIERNTVVRGSHVAYSGGPGGINHPPTAEERTYMHEAHTAPTAAQQAHVQAARADHSNYFNSNHGQPQHAAVERPMTSPGFRGNGNVGAQARGNGNVGGQARGNYNANANANARTRETYRPQAPQNQGRPMAQQGNRQKGQQPPRPQYQPRPEQLPRPESHPQPHPESRPQPREPRRH